MSVNHYVNGSKTLSKKFLKWINKSIGPLSVRALFGRSFNAGLNHRTQLFMDYSMDQNNRKHASKDLAPKLL